MRPDNLIDRINFADIYPRREDPYQPGPAITPGSLPAASMLTPEQLQAAMGAGADPFSLLLTQAGQRPVVYQRANQFSITADVTPVPLQAGSYQCDSFVINAPAGGGNVFVGFGSGVTVASGLQVVAGIPQEISCDNSREQWELQRLLEVIAAMIANERGYSILGNYRAPRVVLDASQWYVVAAAPVPITVMLFNVPEQQ
jgi:hypothetical protein